MLQAAFSPQHGVGEEAKLQALAVTGQYQGDRIAGQASVAARLLVSIAVAEHPLELAVLLQEQFGSRFHGAFQIVVAGQRRLQRIIAAPFLDTI